MSPSDITLKPCPHYFRLQQEMCTFFETQLSNILKLSHASGPQTEYIHAHKILHVILPLRLGLVCVDVTIF